MYILNNDSRLQTVTLYTYQFNIDVKETLTAPLWEQSIVLEEIVSIPSIHAQRQLYSQLGKQPSRYRSSIEALMRRLAQNKGLYAINNVVDAGNLLSLALTTPIGIYDADVIQGNVELKVGGNEPYETIGKGLFNIENLPVLYDEIGPFGNPNSDSKRTMVTETTKQILVVIYAFEQEGISTEQLHMCITEFQKDLKTM